MFFVFCLATASHAAEWRPLFDGKTLAGWKPTAFAGAGDVEVTNGVIVLNQGIMTGINWTNSLPQGSYEVALEARRTIGSDFFCGLTFPVRDTFATLIVGGWGGGVVGLSSLDGEDAAHNETTSYHRFKLGEWHRVRLAVAPKRIQAWLDDESVVDVDITSRRVSLREGDIELSKPFGIASWSTTAELRNLQWRALPSAEAGAGAAALPVAEGGNPLVPAVAEAAKKLAEAALHDPKAWPRLAELGDRFGPRLVGSTNLESAIDWILERMSADGLDNPHGEPVTAPRWVRGVEQAEMVAPRHETLVMLGLGGSVGTPKGGLTAPVLVVTNFADLERRAAEARGRIVLFNVPFTSYGETVAYRARGPSAAGRLGAAAVLVRSVTPESLRSPHTGQLHYDDTAPRIPAAAVTVEDAERLARWQARGIAPVVHLAMDASAGKPAAARNVVAEWRGAENPEQIVVVGGHIDSWDVGQGAQDDGGNCVAAWEAVRLMKALGLRPKRTIRVVLWTAEENSGAGAAAYRERHLTELPLHIAAIESDTGVFAPRGFDYTAGAAATPALRAISLLLEKTVGAGELETPCGEADLGPLGAAGVPILGLRVQADRYFWYHHTLADTVDHVSPEDLGKVTAALAVEAYALADWPQPLPR